MANNLTIIISALDRTGAGFRSVDRGLTRVNRAMSRTSRQAQGLTAVQRFMRGATGKAAWGAAGLAGLIGGVAYATAKILSLESAWANTVRAMSNKSVSLGIDTRQLFGLQSAAKQVGIGGDQATSSVENVTRGFYEASWGRDNEKLAIYRHFGMTGRDAQGKFSPERLIEEIAEAGERVNARNGPLARHKLFEALGADGLEDLLNKGRSEVAARYARGVQLAPTQDDIDHANRYAQAMSDLDAQFDKTKSTILGSLAPALTQFLRDTQTAIERLTGTLTPEHAKDAGDRVVDGLEMLGMGLKGQGFRTQAEVDANPYQYSEQQSLDQTTGGIVTPNVAQPPPGGFGKLGQMAARLWPNGFGGVIQQTGNFMRGRGSISNSGYDPKAAAVIDYFQKKGWTREQAIGIAANLFKESSFDPNAVGDNGTAFGLAQYHADRLEDLRKFANVGSPYATTAQQQLDYLDYDLRKGKYKSAGDALASAQTAEQAAGIFSAQYERPADKAGEIEQRAGIAHAMAALYGPRAAAPTAQQQSDAASTGKKDGQLNVNINLGNLPQGSRADVTSSPNVTSNVQRGSTGSTSQFAMGAQF